jgi:hypothetical protein
MAMNMKLTVMLVWRKSPSLLHIPQLLSILFKWGSAHKQKTNLMKTPVTKSI